MKLNYDCMRDILLEIEKQPLSNKLSYGDLCNNLENMYSKDDISYSCLKLKEAGYIIARMRVFETSIVIFSIDDLSIEGHEFLNTIRSDSVWDKTKEKAKSIGVESIQAIVDIAKAIAASLIQSMV